MFLSLDQGTTSSRALVFDPSGRLVATAQRALTASYPRPGWVEQDPDEIWSTQAAAAEEALARARLAPRDVTAVGVANQRETVVLWDRKSGRPVAPAIVWQDRRTTAACRRPPAGGAEARVRRLTGLRLDPYFSATKLAWLLDHVPGARRRAARGELAAGTVDTWLAWKLTGGGVHVTDASNASRTLLCRIDTGTWDDELLGLFRVPREVLPVIGPTAGPIGHCSAVAPGAPLTALVGDQQAALFGQAGLHPGDLKVTYGTGCFLLANLGTSARRAPAGLITTVAWRLGARLTYALEGSVFVGGAAVQFCRDNLGLIETAESSAEVAASVADTGGVVLVPALTGLGAPWWDPRARGALLGLTRGSCRAHLVRAALEGIAHQVADVVEAMTGRDRRPARIRVDGGATGNDVLLALQADLLDSPVVRPQQRETTALGAALLAGLGAGIYPDAAAAVVCWREDRVFNPGLSAAARRSARRRWKQAVAAVRAFPADD